MTKLLLLLIPAIMIACGDDKTASRQLDSLKKGADTVVKKVETSEAMDSIKSKGGKLLDFGKTKGREVWDSAKSKGSQLINKGDKKLNELKKTF